MVPKHPPGNVTRRETETQCYTEPTYYLYQCLLQPSNATVTSLYGIPFPLHLGEHGGKKKPLRVKEAVLFVSKHASLVLFYVMRTYIWHLCEKSFHC